MNNFNNSLHFKDQKIKNYSLFWHNIIARLSEAEVSSRQSLKCSRVKHEASVRTPAGRGQPAGERVPAPIKIPGKGDISLLDSF